LKWYKFLNSALPALLNGMLYYQYFVTASKLSLTTIWSAFVHKHWKRIENCTLFNLSMEIGLKIVSENMFCIGIYTDY